MIHYFVCRLDGNVLCHCTKCRESLGGYEYVPPRTKRRHADKDKRLSSTITPHATSSSTRTLCPCHRCKGLLPREQRTIREHLRRQGLHIPRQQMPLEETPISLEEQESPTFEVVHMDEDSFDIGEENNNAQ